MIVVLNRDSTKDDLSRIEERIEGHGLKAQISTGVERTVVGVLGAIPSEFKDEMELMPGVAEVMIITKPYKLASREFHPEGSIVRVGAVLGGRRRADGGHRQSGKEGRGHSASGRRI